jgi:protein-S-isoprenylcysteine O-methyltransferase Ste14
MALAIGETRQGYDFVRFHQTRLARIGDSPLFSRLSRLVGIAIMLTNRLAREGDWLFRHRSFLPLLLLPLTAWSLLHVQHYLGGSHLQQHAWGAACCALSWLGWLVRATTVGFVPAGTSGRNTSSQRATELNTTGWYSLTRNPLYLGNYLIGLGIMAAWADLELTLAYTAAFWLYYERIISREEQFLLTQFGDDYTAWVERTPAFLPALRRWERPRYPFSLRTVLRREYSAVLLIGIAFQLVDMAEHWLVDARLYCDPSWTAQLVVCAIWYAYWRTIKKRTKWLRVAGR